MGGIRKRDGWNQKERWVKEERYWVRDGWNQKERWVESEREMGGRGKRDE